MKRSVYLTLCFALFLILCLPGGCRKKTETASGEPSRNVGRNYYDPGRFSRWEEPVRFYVDPDCDPQLAAVYRDTLSDWLPTCREVGLDMAETADRGAANVILLPQQDYSNTFGYTAIYNKGDTFPGIRRYCEMSVSRWKRSEKDHTALARVVKHEWGHVLFADGDADRTLTPDKRNIMRSPTSADNVSIADRDTLRRNYGRN